MRELPKIMVAPNGARKQKSDHPALPITHDEIVECAYECFTAGAGGIHLHVRKADGSHFLDVDAYRRLVHDIERKQPEKYIQVSTELAGVYKPCDQFELLTQLKPKAISLSLAEVESDGDAQFTANVYEFIQHNNIDVQHIIYSPEELVRFLEHHKNGIFLPSTPKLLFVLGRYSDGKQSVPQDLDPFLRVLVQSKVKADWALCAFGKRETECLLYANSKGGKMRVGFENSFWNADGCKALSNQERVVEIHKLNLSHNKGSGRGTY